MENYTVTSLYQNKGGELCALVEQSIDGSVIYRIVENIERVGYSSEMLIEEAERGFDGYATFCSFDYGGYSFAEVAYGIEEESDYRLIARIEDNVAEVLTDNMNAVAKSLLSPLIPDFTATLPEFSYTEPCESYQLSFFAA